MGGDAAREDERRTAGDDHPTRTGGPRRDLRGWDHLVERRIREAMEAGAFDDLPFQGERLPADEAGAWGVAGRLLRRAGVAPPWIETDKAIRALLDERDGILRRAAWSSPLGRRRDREAIVRIVAEVDRLALRLEQEAPTPSQHRRRLDLDEELARLEAAGEARRTEAARTPVRRPARRPPS
jgi:DnaJ homologue, subfamily C, member 28, conserved domain